MKKRTQNTRHGILIAALVCCYCSGSCNDRGSTNARGTNDNRLYEEALQSQMADWKRQDADWEKQQRRIEAQDTRYEAILTKWEETNRRVTALLDRWESVLHAVEQHARPAHLESNDHTTTRAETIEAPPEN